MKQLLLSVLVAVALLLGGTTTSMATTTISSFTPSTGSVGTTVTIIGTNFSTTPANNVVFFGATRTTVSASTATSLTVTVPTAATYAPITVLNTETTLAAYSSANFTPTFTPNVGHITTLDIAAKADFTSGTQPWSVSIGDIDGDGKLDLAVVYYGSNTVSVLRNTSTSGAVSFAAKTDYATGTLSRSVGIGDIDGDGKLDLAVVNYGSNTVSVLRNTSISGAVSFAAKADFATGTWPMSVSIRDIDGDGKPDLAVANEYVNTLSVLRNTSTAGAVNFAAKTDLATGAKPRSVGIGDIDGDGKPDLAVVNYGDNTVCVFRNTSTAGNLSFADKANFPTGTSPNSVSMGDIDGDGKLDLAVANSDNTSNSISVLRNTSTSGILSLANKVDFATGTNPLSVSIGDIDGDGKPDLAVANSTLQSISVLRNTSTSGILSLANKVDFATGMWPASVSIGDIDGDGKPDLAVSNSSSQTISIFRNTPIFPPTVATQAVSDISSTTATGNGIITALGSVNPTSYGICWNKTGTPTTSDSKVDNGAVSATGAFTGSMTNLTPNTTYYVRAYATNAANTGYGTVVSFTTNPLATAPTVGDGTSVNPYQIVTLEGLNWISQTPAVWNNYFIQTADIDATSTSTWFGGAGFSPIGNYSNKFSGNYNGQNHTINGLTINTPSTDYVGFFGYLNSSPTPTISNIGLTNVSIIGHDKVGGLVGWNNAGNITNAYTTGTVKGNNLVGGLIGMNNYGSISKSFSNANTEGVNDIGGLIGQTYGGSISNTYATGSVKGTDLVAGLIGYFGSSASVLNSYAVGSITGSTNVGGLIGFKETLGTISNSFWDIQTTEQAISAAGNGKTTAQMKAFATFYAVGWDFKGESKNGSNDIWNIGNGKNNGYPYFNWQFTTDPAFSVPTPTIASATFDALTGVLALSCTNITSGDVINPSKFTLTGEGGNTYTLTTANVAANSSTSVTITLNATDKVAINNLFNKNGTSSISSLSYNLAVANNWDTTAISENMADATNAVTVSNVTLPTVTTQDVTLISVTTATGNGNIINFGTSNPTQYGIVWSTSTNPTIALATKAEQGSNATTGAFTSSITGLSPNTRYYVKAYATNSAGTGYGSEVTFTTQYLAQSISFGALDDKTYGDPDYSPGAISATSGINPLTYSSSNDAVATIVSGKIHIVGVGKTNITTKQGGNSTYNAATDVTQQLIVVKRAITISADAKTKTYGSAEPGLTAQVTAGTIVTGDFATGSLTRIAGETVADYAINKGTYTYGSNYDETYLGAKLSIGKRAINVSAVVDTKIYDGTNSSSVSPTYDALVNGDVVNTVPVQVFDDATVGTTHVLTAAGLTINNGGADATGNYVINYTPTKAAGVIKAKQVSVTNPIITESKVYDSNKTANVIAGFLSEVLAADVNDVTITATATYSDSSAGSDKIITVHYTLSGPASGYYVAPADYIYKLAAVKIVRKQLTISAPVVVANKMVDGNSTAVITTTGTLQGVEKIDTSNVTVTATANYDNSAVGSNKTITVVYTLSGSAKDNYKEPENFVITGAKISDNSTISPLGTLAPGCENATLDLTYTILTGTPTQFKITFDSTSVSAGIQDISYTNLPSNNSSGYITIAIPKGTPDGDYQGTLQVKNELGVESPAYKFQFTINVSSDYLISKFEDVILCDNSSKRFKAYQWYKNGVKIDGATKQVYNDLEGLVGTYSLEVTTVDGKTIFTCPKEYAIPTGKKVKVFPIPVKSSQPCFVKVLGFDTIDLEGAALSVYTLQGIQVYHSKNIQNMNSLKLPNVPGTYVGNLTTANGKDYAFKVIVVQ